MGKIQIFIGNKVRPSCASNEGKIFDITNLPSGGNPRYPYNCRCVADFQIPDYIENIVIDSSIKFVRKDMVYVLKYA